MKGLLVIVGALVLGFLAFSLTRTPEAPPAAKSAAVPAGAAVRAPVTARPLTPNWPPVKEDAAKVSADLFAKNYYVVFDGSGSMNDTGCSGSVTKIQAAKSALASFSESVPAHANLGLLVFDGNGVSERLALGTGNREQFTRLVNRVRANAGTPLRTSVEKAYARLLEQGAKQLGYGEYHLVIVTDGLADGAEDPTPAVDKLLAESPIVVQTIGFCIGTRHSLNQPGRTIYRAADNVAELRQGLADVLAEAPQFAVTQFK